MIGIARCPTGRHEGGFTFLEVLVALAILSLLAVGAWNAASVSLRLASGIRGRIIEASRLLELDDRLRALTARVRTPYWAAGPAVSLAEGECRVAWLDGNPDRVLVLGFRGGVLSVGDGETAAVYADFGRVDFLAALDAEGRPFGLSVTLGTRDGRVVTVIGRFGGSPVRGAP